nr:hypothetical protein [Tanacetum cinerariifolium]
MEWRTNAPKDEMPSVGKDRDSASCRYEAPLLTTTASRVIDMEDMAVASEEATTEVIPESSLEKEVAAMVPVVNKRRRKRGNEGAGANAPPRVLRKDYAASRPAKSTRGEKSIVPMGLDAGSAFSMPTTQDVLAAAKSVSDPDPLSNAEPQPHPERDIANSKVREIDPFLSVNGSPEGIYQPGHSQDSRTRSEDQGEGGRDKKLDQEIKSFRTMETEVHGLRNQTKNLETLLKAEVDMKNVAEAKNIGLAKELESLRAQFVDLQVNNNQLSQQVSTLRAQVFADVISAGVAKGISEGLKHGIEHGKANLDLSAIEAYNPEDKAKYVVAFYALKDLKYPLVDQLEKLKNVPIDLIMASLYLKSDSREDAP